MPIGINSDLHLVLPLRVDENGRAAAYAYHTPISMATFDANFRVLAAAKSALFDKGPRYAFEVGAQVAALHLRDAGRRDAQERMEFDASGNPTDGGVDALLADLRRLTMVAVPSASGWEQVPVDVAVQRGALDAEDMREVDNALVFFTCIYFLTARAQRAQIASVAASVCRGSTASSSLTDWIASLPTLTLGGNTPPAA